MNRNYNYLKQANDRIQAHELLKKTAIHEAGHAAAIYLGNKQKQLPPIFFQIFINTRNKQRYYVDNYAASGNHFAHIEGGRLIQILPSSVQEELRYLCEIDRENYLRAFEADIVNLLVGPLSEAKYVALNDNEPINPRLVNLDSLHYYGGSSDLKAVREYIDCLFDDQAQKEKKILELFLAAYNFINNRSNWNAISALAEYILFNGKKTIDCEEAIAILDGKAVYSKN